MNLKSITFRCTALQHGRMQAAVDMLATSRTNIITSALEAFLSYAEQEHISRMNLFDLVEDIDTVGNGPRFADEA